MARKVHTLYLLICIICCISTPARAQHFEMGVMLGGSNYWGDLAASPVIGETNAAFGGFARINLSSSFAFTANLINARISGNDNNFDHQRIRNLNFTTDLTEFSGIVEFNFKKFGVDVNEKRHTPYVFLGLAFTQYIPTATYNNNRIELRNIRTEEVQYGLFTVAIPMGIGYKWQFAKHAALNWNIGFRRSYSDYLDDVSGVYPDNFAEIQRKKGFNIATATDPSAANNRGIPISERGYRRGNPDFTDWYVVSTVSISWRFYKKLKCRRFY
jgi:hypothetical protein